MREEKRERRKKKAVKKGLNWNTKPNILMKMEGTLHKSDPICWYFIDKNDIDIPLSHHTL
jgi:hypothetical protein